MFYLFFEFAMQLGLVCVLLTAFILAQLYFGTPRGDGDTDAEFEQAPGDGIVTAGYARSQRGKSTVGASRPAASLADVPMRRGEPRPRPIFGRKVNV